MQYNWASYKNHYYLLEVHFVSPMYRFSNHFYSLLVRYLSRSFSWVTFLFYSFSKLQYQPGRVLKCKKLVTGELLETISIDDRVLAIFLRKSLPAVPICVKRLPSKSTKMSSPTIYGTECTSFVYNVFRSSSPTSQTFHLRNCFSTLLTCYNNLILSLILATFHDIWKEGHGIGCPAHGVWAQCLETIKNIVVVGKIKWYNNRDFEICPY